MEQMEYEHKMNRLGDLANRVQMALVDCEEMRRDIEQMKADVAYASPKNYNTMRQIVSDLADLDAMLVMLKTNLNKQISISAKIYDRRSIDN